MLRKVTKFILVVKAAYADANNVPIVLKLRTDVIRE